VTFFGVVNDLRFAQFSGVVLWFKVGVWASQWLV
jgi:hypothetical protein